MNAIINHITLAYSHIITLTSFKIARLSKTNRKHLPAINILHDSVKTVVEIINTGTEPGIKGGV